MIVRISAEAEHDIEAIGDYIAIDNPARAISFVGELRSKCQELAEFPDRFPLWPGRESTGVRRGRHGRYMIFYRFEDGFVFVLHIVHGARDHESILFDDDDNEG